jgi:hypothetical protein
MLCFFSSFAQNEESENIKKRKKTINNAVLISIFYDGLIPVGELSQRFGYSNGIGLDISYKVRGNWLIGVEGAYLFSSHVKENQILSPVSTYTGQFIQSNGQLGDIPLELSGFRLGLKFGKVFSISKKHPNSGIVFSVEPGFLQHKIWIKAIKDSYPQFSPAYLTGYDRLTNGPMVSGYLGYMYLERKKFLSFSGGLTYTAGFTENRRAWNFFDASGNVGGPDKHHRLDMMIGFRLAWIIPVFTNKDTEVYYK